MATVASREGLLLGRVKSLDAILATAEKKGLHRSLGAFQLTLLGIGAVIGTGIFVLTAEAAQKAGPAMMISFVIAGFVTILLMVGTKESARFNAVLVLVKVTALTIFCILTLPVLKGEHFHPFIPNGWGTYGVVGAASSIFFAYVGFDAVSTAAEETNNPQRNVPIGLIGSHCFFALFYLVLAPRPPV